MAHLVVCEGNLTAGGGKATKHFSSFSENDFAQVEFPKMIKQWQSEAAQGDMLAQFFVDAWLDVDFGGIHRSASALVDLDQHLKQQYFDIAAKRMFVFGELSLAVRLLAWSKRVLGINYWSITTRIVSKPLKKTGQNGMLYWPA